MDRRTFFGAATLACLGAPFVVRAQKAKEVRRIGMAAALGRYQSERAAKNQHRL